jgi:uncharacterized protein (UPF0371 family)
MEALKSTPMMKKFGVFGYDVANRRQARMAKKKAEQVGREFKVGDAVKVKLNDGRIVNATVRSVMNNDGKQKLQVDYGHEETALIGAWQIET